MTDHPRAIAARMSHSPRVAARATGLTQAEVRAIRDLKATRSAAQKWIDPLVLAARSRAWRRLSAIAAEQVAADAARAARDAEIARQIAAEATRAAVRKTLLRAARVARAMNLYVKASKDRNGHVSSYYVQSGERRIRVSDHLIPATDRRDTVAFERGQYWGYDGYRGPEIIIDRERSATWLRRALTLAAAGRGAP